MYNNETYKVSTKAGIVSIYLFAFLFFALYGNQGYQTMNQVILWGFGPMIAFYILEPNIVNFHKLPGEYFLYLSMVLFSFLGYLNIKDESLFYRYLQVFIANFVLMTIVYFAINNIKEWVLAWKIIAVVGVLISLIGFFNEAPAIDEEYFRLTGIAGNANGTANYARVATLAGLIWLQFVEKKISKLFIWAVIIFLGYTILLTASRGVFANLVVIWGGYVAFKYFSGWRLIILMLIIFVFGNLILILGEQFLSDFYLFQRLFRNDTFSAAMDEEARLQIYAVAWNYFLEYPLLGVGLNQFRLYSDGKISHTDVLDILVQLGIFAGIIYVYIYVKLYNQITKLKRFFKSNKDIQIYQLVLLCFISEMFFGLGNPNWFTQLQMVVLSLLIIYVYKIRNTDLRKG